MNHDAGTSKSLKKKHNTRMQKKRIPERILGGIHDKNTGGVCGRIPRETPEEISGKSLDEYPVETLEEFLVKVLNRFLEKTLEKSVEEVEE